MTRAPRHATLLATLLTIFATACSGGPADNDDCNGAKCDDGDQRAEARLCAAVRGNGQLISAHFASLARITEHYGLVDAAAGGSSASITIFMTESIRKNSQVWNCGGSSCSEEERAARAALLLKSFPGYLQHLSTTDEAAAFMQLQPLLAKIQTQGIEELAAEDAAAAATALLEILESDDIRDLINPEIIALLSNSPTPEFHVNDIVAGIKSLGNFSADDSIIFIRPGLINFEAMGEKLGRAASFYAGYGPADNYAMADFMESCAAPGVGKTWFEVAAMPAGDSTCGQMFDAMVGEYRAELIANEDAFPSRIDDKVGAVMPALISTSVLTGDAVDTFAAARQSYARAEAHTLDINFDDVKFGYWGAKQDVVRVSENRNGYDDLKTQKFMNLGEATWREVLAYSPAEPGLARALELPNGDVSAGGWSDLHPTLALANLGCEEIIYVTRTGDESNFAIGVANLLGMSEAESRELYDLDSNSAYSLSVAEADATWCTNWNEMDALNLPAITADGYNAPMGSVSDFFTSGPRPYHNTEAAVAKRGCSVAAQGSD